MVTVITRTIGPSGRDYASFTLAEADVTNIGTSADLVANDEAIVFEADAGSYNESVTFSSTLTTDATRQVTYKPAAGSEHGGSLSTGVRLGAGSYSQNIQDSYTALSGLSIEMTAATNTVTLAITAGQGVAVENCLLLNDGNREALRVGLGASAAVGSASEPLRLSNCVFHTGAGFSYVYAIQITTGSGHAVYADLLNCTIATNPASAFYFMFVNKGSATLEANFVNCISFATKTMASVGSPTITGSNNFGGSSFPFPAALQGSPYPITATTSLSPGAGDWAIYEAATGRLYDVPDNDVWGQGVGPSSNPDVPTTDIVRALRSGSTANPGAFEAPAVFTTNQSVAPNGRLEADRISHIYPYTYIAQSKTSALSGGETVSYHWYFKVDSTLVAGAGETITFSIKDSGGTVVEEINWAVAYDDATPTVALGSTTTAGSGYTTDALEYVAVSNDWVRCSITLTDFGSTGQDVEVTHTSLTGAAPAGTIYDVTLWGSEVTTIDRTPTATDLRPISGGIVDYDAYPAEHRSLFASYEDAGDNWYKVTMNLTEPN